MPEFTQPTKCRMVLFYPWDFTNNVAGEPLPAVVTHVGTDWVHLVVLDGSRLPAASDARFVPHLSVPQDPLETAYEQRVRWDWPPRS